MSNQQQSGDSSHSVEGVRAFEVRRLVRKLDLSPEQREAVEILSCSLVEELVYGPIAETAVLVQELKEKCGH